MPAVLSTLTSRSTVQSHARRRLGNGDAVESASASLSPSRCLPRVKSAPTTVTRAVQGRDRSFYQWVDDEGISAPCIGIGYVGGGIPDANETYRGCVVTNPIASGDVLVRCPSNLALALPPSPPNPFPTSSRTRCGTILPARDVGLRSSEWRSSSFASVCWAMPLAGTLPPSAARVVRSPGRVDR